ncbi:hypothetical protein EON71_01155 [bacterium]|nr:MAG: hypothetical protein EON71_01155 [bacterium]
MSEFDTEMFEGNEYNESDPLVDDSHTYDDGNIESVEPSVESEIESQSDKTPTPQQKYIFI